MKGKYTNAAEKRRATEALEARATAAESERDHLARKLEVLAAKYDRDVSALRVSVTQVSRERDENTSGRVTQLEKLCDRLRVQVVSVREQYKFQDARMKAAASSMAAALVERVGWKPLDAQDFVWNAMFPMSGENLIWPKGGSRDPRVIRAVQAIRGQRGSPGAEIGASDKIQTFKQSRHAAGLLKKETQESLSPSFTYEIGDGRFVSVMTHRNDERLTLVTDDGESSVDIPAREMPRLMAAMPSIVAGGTK